MTRRLAIVVMTGLLFVGLCFPHATQHSTNSIFIHATDLQGVNGSYSENLKGVVIDPDFTSYGNHGGPSLEMLAFRGFGVAGTIAYYDFDESNWIRLGTWLKEVHEVGLLSLVDLWGNGRDFSTEVEMAKRAAALGVDFIALDEPISMYNVTREQLQFIVNSILQVNPSQWILINEYNRGVIKNAYSWTAKYPNVRIATDQYDDRGVIDFGISLASQYGKKSIVWLIFTQGSQDFDCYTHFDEWMKFVTNKSADVFFWYIDRSGLWMARWPLVAAFRAANFNGPAQPMQVFVLEEIPEAKCRSLEHGL